MNRPSDHDPMRSLDQVDPPDQWDDILLRAESIDVGDLPTATDHSMYRRLLVAAVVLALVGLTGIVAFTVRSGNATNSEAVSADQSGTPGHTSTPIDGAPGTVATTPDGSPVPTTAPGGDSGDGSGSAHGGTGSDPDGSGGSGQGGTGSGGHGTRTTTPMHGGTTSSQPNPPSSTSTPSTSQPVTTTSVPLSSPPGGIVEGFWGRKWTVTALTDSGTSRALGGRTLVLDASNEGQVSILVCNRLGGPTSLQGDHLSVALEPTTQLACGEPIDGNEAFFSALLQGNPVASVSADKLTLTSGGRRAEFAVVAPSS